MRDDNDEMAFYDKPSKSQLKREAESMQKLGEELLKLKEGELKTLDIPLELREAISEARLIKSNAALKRQRQYLGKLMRALDGEKIRAQLAYMKQSSDEYLRIERWVESVVTKLIAEDEQVYAEISEELPLVDHQYLRQMIRNMAREIKEGKGKSKTRTILFRYLRELMQEHLTTTSK